METALACVKVRSSAVVLSATCIWGVYEMLWIYRRSGNFCRYQIFLGGWVGGENKTRENFSVHVTRIQFFAARQKLNTRIFLPRKKIHAKISKSTVGFIHTFSIEMECSDGCELSS